MSTTPSVKKRKRPDARPIVYCVVVESHQHVLEHIHTVLRKERLLSQEWSMLHFDAHPDLACPHDKIPAKACFLPHETTLSDEGKNLYELLDSTATGIAEWILPLVLAANLRNVQWVKSRMETTANEDTLLLPKPPFQLPLGNHHFHVGASVPDDKKVESFMDLPVSATVKVDWPHPYYLEDGCTAHYGNEKNGSESFLFQQPLHLEISELSAKDTCENESTKQKENNPQYRKVDRSLNHEGLWSLDICLDYFVCQNPFLTDLEAKDAVFTRALLNAVYESRFYVSSIMTIPNESTIIQANETVLQHYQRDIRLFWSLVVTLLKEAITDQDTRNKDTMKKLLVYYVDQCKGRKLLEQLMKAFLATKDSQHPETPSTLVAMTEQALPNLVMPHQSTSETAFSMEGIQPSLERVCREIERKSSASRAPFIITMARSSSDGFTPTLIADQLQNKLIRFLHSHFCGCQECPLQRREKQQSNGNCRFQLIFDYGSWEGTVFS